MRLHDWFSDYDVFRKRTSFPRIERSTDNKTSSSDSRIAGDQSTGMVPLTLSIHAETNPGLFQQTLSYSLLLPMLQIGSIRELEDLIIDAIYLDVLKGKLDQKNEQFEVEYTMGRDLEPGRIDKLLVSLQNW